MTATPEDENRQRLEALLAAGERRSRRWRLARIALGAVALALVAFGWMQWRAAGEPTGPQFVTRAVERGELVVTVSATGNLQPTNKVDVGSELSGTIEAVLVDDNDRVRKGQVLARLDVSRLSAQVARSRAALQAARARVQQAEATVTQSRSNLGRLREVARLSGGKVPSKSEMDVAEATLARALADAASAEASVTEVRAQLSSDETNLRKASIRSPIDGVVLSRRVEPGQTVAASLQAPILFTLAETLSQMELQVDVDEADVGLVREGQEATFAVDAWPGRRYPARITRVGYGSQVKEGVVSYPTVLVVDNADLTLRPGMTATAEIVTAVRQDALLVPNAALRFTPPVVTAVERRGFTGFMPRPPSTPRAAPAEAEDGSRRVFVLRDGEAWPVRVEAGASNGSLTEIVGGALEPGMAVIVEIAGAAK